MSVGAFAPKCGNAWGNVPKIGRSYGALVNAPKTAAAEAPFFSRRGANCLIQSAVMLLWGLRAQVRGAAAGAPEAGKNPRRIGCGVDYVKSVLCSDEA